MDREKKGRQRERGYRYIQLHRKEKEVNIKELRKQKRGESEMEDERKSHEILTKREKQ